VWAWITIYGVDSMMVAVHLGDGPDLRHTSPRALSCGGAAANRERRGTGPGLGVHPWGIHHLTTVAAPVRFGGSLRRLVDVLFLFAIGLGLLFIVVGDAARKLATRTVQLEQLTRLLLRAQEDERRRIARELHDEAGQVLTAVKIELDLEGRREAGALVGRALAQVRDLSNLLRPSVLDDLGLVAALHALANDFSTRTRIETDVVLDGATRRLPPDIEVVIYRVVQEALTNIAKHAQASRATVRLSLAGTHAALSVEDDGRGLSAETGQDGNPHLGWLGMRERVTGVGGSLTIGAGAQGGVRLDAFIPTEARA
jgi:signal transduction histidine kinase